MRKKIVLDANLLVLLVVGLTDRDLIAKHKRLRIYTHDDFEILQRTIQESSGILVTPNALSEASNFLRQIADPDRSSISTVFSALIQKTSELYIKSADASLRKEFLWLGLADNVLLEVGKLDVVLVSTDAALCVAAQKAGYSALNFNHIRNL